LNNRHIGINLTFADKVLMLFVWLVKYPSYGKLSELFGTTLTVVSTIITHYHHHFVVYFKRYIPNKFQKHCSTSVLSNNIVAIIDSTIHAIQKPARCQHLHYNSNYQRHSMLTHLLVDFDNLIVAVETNVKGRIHDANAAQNNFHFQQILQNKFALGDPGYARVFYVIVGYKSNEIHQNVQLVFDQISRQEQIGIGHVNRHLKQCKVLSKHSQFIHNRTMHVGCVFLIYGWYNWMYLTFDYFKSLIK
jgi:hypothetical protein